MIRLKDILLENTENRVNLMKLEALMEKMLPELTKTENTKLTQLCTEVHEMVGKFNTLPYTIHNRDDWTVLRIALMAKLLEIKTEAEKMVDSDKVDVQPFIKALDEILVN
jgi:hypothetical protein